MNKTLIREAKQREGIYGNIGLNWFKNALKRKDQNLIWQIDRMIADKSADSKTNPVMNGYVGGLHDVMQMLKDMNQITDEGIVDRSEINLSNFEQKGVE